MKLLVEKVEDVQFITEEVEGKKRYYIEGIYIQSMVKNGNGRYYPKNIIENQVGQFQKMIDEKRSIGELGHPNTPQLNLDRASHLITSLKMEGNNAIGRAKILNTPMGKIAEALLAEDVKIGVSTRGMGSVKPSNEGYQVVQDDFRLATIDIVSNPSAPDAFVQGLYEGKEWVMENGMWKISDAEQARNELKTLPKSMINERIDQMFQKFLNGK